MCDNGIFNNNSQCKKNKMKLDAFNWMNFWGRMDIYPFAMISTRLPFFRLPLPYKIAIFPSAKTVQNFPFRKMRKLQEQYPTKIKFYIIFITFFFLWWILTFLQFGEGQGGRSGHAGGMGYEMHRVWEVLREGKWMFLRWSVWEVWWECHEWVELWMKRCV